MSLWKKNLPATSNNALYSLQNEMNDLFETFNKEFYSPMGKDTAFAPKLEIKEDDKTYKVSAELPGMSENDIHVSLRDNALIIEGEKKYETTKEEKGVTRSEFSYGSFYRSVPFRAEINAEKVSANYKNGVLSIVMEKADQHSAKNRKITIKKD